MPFYLTPFYHVGPTVKTKEGAFEFSTFDVNEGLKTRTYEVRSLAAIERGALLRGLRMGKISYLSYPDASTFNRSIRELRKQP